jgi:naphthalene 1,2-dioxygenase system ferredoxin subunit
MDSNQWIDATAADDVPEDDVIGVFVDGRDIALYNAGGEIFATDNISTHGQARLCEGFLEGHEIEALCIRAGSMCGTGRPTGPPSRSHSEATPSG